FGTAVDASTILGETLDRATPEFKEDPVPALAEVIRSDAPPPNDYESFRLHPLASWIESNFGVRTEFETGRLIRQPAQKIRGVARASERLATLTSPDPEQSYTDIRSFPTKGYEFKRSTSNS